MGALFNSMYEGKKVFVTGHTGFKGSWLCLWLTQLGAEVVGYSLQPSTEPAHYNLLQLDMESIIGDITDRETLQKHMERTSPDIVIHMAAQPLVRYSYRHPHETYMSNVIGTCNVCEACRHIDSVRALVAVTTDKVYENNEWIWGYREIDRLGGFDPYSASKACAETVISSYRNSYLPPDSYGTNHSTLIASVRAGNVIGGGDWSQDRLIPDIAKATAKGENVVIRNPGGVRPWQHVLECLSGYLTVGAELLRGRVECGDAFNFGPDADDAIPVGQMVAQMKKYWPDIRSCAQAQADAPHEAGYLKLDCAKARHYLHWRPVWGCDTALELTAQWYRDFYKTAAVNSSDNLHRYIEEARRKEAVWTK